MAAAPELPARDTEFEVAELRNVDGPAMSALLDQEAAIWRETLRWDFSASAKLVARFLDVQALRGYVLLHRGAPVGFSYYVCEERKGLIGDLYVSREFASVETEGMLLSAVLGALSQTPPVRRVESQLMMLRHAKPPHLPLPQYLRMFERLFLEIALPGSLKPRPDARGILYEGWTERRQDDAALMIAASYRQHIDSEINDQYRSAPGARRFLVNIIQYPGCGSFYQPASFVAVDAANGQLRGICLCSLVSADAGHVTQVCVGPSMRGHGIGYEMMRRSLEVLTASGCTTASLTVTAANHSAVELYLRMGFTQTKAFTAHVWEGF